MAFLASDSASIHRMVTAAAGGLSHETSAARDSRRIGERVVCLTSRRYLQRKDTYRSQRMSGSARPTA